jgi:gluconate 2-dehydrogenase alpha chain
VDTQVDLTTMARRLPEKDVVIVGLGWTGAILAHELTDAGLEVVAIERGPWRNTATDYPPNLAQDELRYRIRHELFLSPSQTTFTFRNKMSQTALPIRSWGAFMPPTESAAVGCTGTRRRGASCHRTSC